MINRNDKTFRIVHRPFDLGSYVLNQEGLINWDGEEMGLPKDSTENYHTGMMQLAKVIKPIAK